MNYMKIIIKYCQSPSLTSRSLSRYFSVISFLLCISYLITITLLTKETGKEVPDILHSRNVLSLENASLKKSSLENASLENTFLENSLGNVFLKNASLKNASLKNASLKSALFENASLENAFLNVRKQTQERIIPILPPQSGFIVEPKNAALLFPSRVISPSNDARPSEAERRRRGTNSPPFGKRPFGPLSRYGPPGDPSLRWIGYFLEESLVPVLQTRDNVMVDCNVIELRDDEEQVAALSAFGSLMELVPLELPEMIQLLRLCGELPKNLVQIDDNEIYSQRTRSDVQNDSRQTFSPVILPGTLWCGLKDRAPRYENLGQKGSLDKCCRAHDHCPLKVGSFETRYGLTNYRFGTRSHCLCEKEFFRCLKKVSNKVADMIGNLYFDVLNVECLDSPQPAKYSKSAGPSARSGRSLYECTAVDEKRLCRFWKKNSMKYAYKFVKLDVEY